MKKTTLLLLWLALCSGKLWGQEYNPYQHGREEYLETLLEMMTADETTDCGGVKEAIENYLTAVKDVQKTKEEDDDRMQKEEILFQLRQLAFFQCQEAFDFLINTMHNDPSEEVRCYAMRILASRRHVEFIADFQKYEKREHLSIEEKSTLATAYSIVGVFNDRQDITNLALHILNEICYDPDGDPINNCIWNYYSIGGQEAIKFFTYYFELQDPPLLWAALRLAELGVYDKTYPVFVEALQSGKEGWMHIAIFGLAAVGTEEAFRLIKEQTQSKNQLIANQSQWIFRYIEIKNEEEKK